MIQGDKIEKILDKKINNDCSISYLIKWVGYSDELNSWEPYEKLTSSLPLIQDFEFQFNFIQKHNCINKLKNNQINGNNNDNKSKPATKKKKGNQTKKNRDKNVPEKLIKIQAENNNLFFCVEWSNKNQTLESYKWVRDNYPYLLISFFEGKIKLDNYSIHYNKDTNEYQLIQNYSVNNDKKKELNISSQL